MLGTIEKLARRVVILLGWLAALLLLAIMALTFVDVIGRNFFGRSVLGTVETISLMMGALVFSGLAITELHRRHIVVETFQGLFPKPIRRMSVIVNSLLAVGVSWLLLEQLFVKTVNVFQEGEFTMILKLPYWPASIVMLVGLALFFMTTVLVMIWIDPTSAPDVADADEAPQGSAIKQVWATLVLFITVIGGIYAGFFTPTEAAGFGAVGALFLGVVMGRLSLSMIGGCLIDTVQTTSMIFLILIGAILFSGFLSLSGTPGLLGSWIVGLELSPLGTIIVIVCIYIVLGAFLDTMAMIILSVPIFFPIVMSMGFDPIWFGVLVVLVVELALITPPLGINVFIIRGLVPHVPLSQIFRGVLPFCIALVALIALVIAVPSIATFLPDLAAA